MPNETDDARITVALSSDHASTPFAPSQTNAPYAAPPAGLEPATRCLEGSPGQWTR
jgi:hypothetical protein